MDPLLVSLPQREVPHDTVEQRLKDPLLLVRKHPLENRRNAEILRLQDRTPAPRIVQHSQGLEDGSDLLSRKLHFVEKFNKMLLGLPAREVYIELPPSLGGL